MVRKHSPKLRLLCNAVIDLHSLLSADASRAKKDESVWSNISCGAVLICANRHKQHITRKINKELTPVKIEASRAYLSGEHRAALRSQGRPGSCAHKLPPKTKSANQQQGRPIIPKIRKPTDSEFSRSAIISDLRVGKTGKFPK